MAFVSTKPIIFPGSAKYLLYRNTIKAFATYGFSGSKAAKIDFTKILVSSIFFQVLARVIKRPTTTAAPSANALPIFLPCCTAL
jgi:hypothetical protein